MTQLRGDCFREGHIIRAARAALAIEAVATRRGIATLTAKLPRIEAEAEEARQARERFRQDVTRFSDKLTQLNEKWPISGLNCLPFANSTHPKKMTNSLPNWRGHGTHITAFRSSSKRAESGWQTWKPTSVQQRRIWYASGKSRLI